MDSFLLESYCLQVIIDAKKGGIPLCDFGNILKDVVREANGLNLCGFSHVLLGGNVHAHVLAKMAISCKSFALWKGVVPLYVSQAACADLPRHLQRAGSGGPARSS